MSILTHGGVSFPLPGLLPSRFLVPGSLRRRFVFTHLLRLPQFYFNFNSRGFLPYGLGAVATFASMPEDRLSTVREPEIRLGMHDYLRWVRRYREQLLEDRIQHVYRDGAGVPIGAIPPLKGRITLEDLLLATADGQLVDGINPGARRG